MVTSFIVRVAKKILIKINLIEQEINLYFQAIIFMSRQGHKTNLKHLRSVGKKWNSTNLHKQPFID